ncbi:MAG TPA: energy transducer TonB [Edaphocola sp.]|nr:energy transducer TonB [Edaphocola sp.]
MNKRLKRILLISALIIPTILVANAVYAQSKNVSKDTDPEPEFIGGKQELQRYLDSNLKYPAKAKAAKGQGVVYVSFTVLEDGKVTNAKIVRSIGMGCDEEALRLVEEMPNWKPGKEDGVIKALPVVIPISFRL